MDESKAIERRIRRLEDREMIRDIVDLYGLVMDERHILGIRRLFTDDVQFGTADGFISIKCLEDLIAMYEGRFAAAGATNHFAHGHVIRFDASDADVARGVVNSHVEVVRQGEPMIAAIRYYDAYRRVGTGWRFSKRLMTYMYYLNVKDYSAAMARDDRVLVYGDSRLADWPVVQTSNPELAWLDALVDGEA